MKLAAITGFLCLGIAASAQEVHFNYDRSANFSSYKTYQWVVDAPTGATNQLMDQNIKRSVNEQLAGKGLREVDNGADIKVVYRVGVDQEKQFTGWGNGPRFYGTARVDTSTIEIGKFAIEMTDAKSNQLVWRGDLSKTLDLKKDPDKNYQTLQKAMAKLFKNYPPGGGKQ